MAKKTVVKRASKYWRNYTDLNFNDEEEEEKPEPQQEDKPEPEPEPEPQQQQPEPEPEPEPQQHPKPEDNREWYDVDRFDEKYQNDWMKIDSDDKSEKLINRISKDFKLEQWMIDDIRDLPKIAKQQTEGEQQ